MAILVARIVGFGLWVESTGLHHVHANPCQVLANLLALAAVCPFVGSLSDLIGRRYVALSGAFFLILGMVVASTAHSMNIFICERHPSFHAR